MLRGYEDKAAAIEEIGPGFIEDRPERQRFADMVLENQRERMPDLQRQAHDALQDLQRERHSFERAVAVNQRLVEGRTQRLAPNANVQSDLARTRQIMAGVGSGDSGEGGVVDTVSRIGKCAGFKPDGTLCTATVKPGIRWCYGHDPERVEERIRNAARAGRTPQTMKEVRAVKTRLDDMTLQLLAGDMDRGVAAVVNQLSGTMLRAIELERRIKETDELERRVEDLEGDAMSVKSRLERLEDPRTDAEKAREQREYRHRVERQREQDEQLQLLYNAHPVEGKLYVEALERFYRAIQEHGDEVPGNHEVREATADLCAALTRLRLGPTGRGWDAT